MIGYNILIHPDQFKSAFLAGHAIAVHTWSHPYLTGLSNLAILSEVSFVLPVLSQENQLNNLLDWKYNENHLHFYRRSCP